MQRVCFLMQVRPDRLDEYRQRHEVVWPEMLAALRAAGWHNYTLFSRDDGLLVGYLETDDFEAAKKAIDASPVNARWQQEMAAYLEPGTDPGVAQLSEYFHLE